jgi:hypothetical protein
MSEMGPDSVIPRCRLNVAFFGIVSTASSDILTVTYKGTVSDGYDQTGVFGPPNTSPGRRHRPPSLFGYPQGSAEDSLEAQRRGVGNPGSSAPQSSLRNSSTLFYHFGASAKAASAMRTTSADS